MTLIAQRLAQSAFLLILGLYCRAAPATEVGYAGFAYAGSADTIAARFPYTSQIVPPSVDGADHVLAAAEIQLRDRMRAAKPKSFDLSVDSLATLEGRDQVILVALVITGETVSTERIEDYTKLFVNLRAQALFFDFKSQTVLRAYPISVVYLGATRVDPGDAEKRARVAELLVGGRLPSIVDHFVTKVEGAALPTSVTRFVGVTNVSIADPAAEVLRSYLPGNGVAETWIADEFSESFMDKTGIALVPFAQGYAIGNTMATRLADGTAFSLKVKETDYSVSLDLLGLKKVKYAEVPAGTSYIYGTLVHVLIQEPILHKAYFDSSLKNGEVKTMSALQTSVDDWPAYEDSISGLFQKFSATVSGAESKWIRSAAVLDLSGQIATTHTVLNSCK